MRTKARETLFKLVFSSQFTGSVENNLKRSLYKIENLDENDIKYCDDILEILKNNVENISSVIDKHSQLFPEKRIFPADKSVLQIAISEILYYGDVPDAVSVNEAANIVSKYSTEKSANFVSGILSEIIREKLNV